MNISLQLARPNSLETAVIAQFKFDGKKRRLGLDVTVPSERWNKGKQRLKVLGSMHVNDQKDCEVLNTLLEAREALIHDVIHELTMDLGKAPGWDQFKEGWKRKLKGRDRASVFHLSFNQMVDEFSEEAPNRTNGKGQRLHQSVASEKIEMNQESKEMLDKASVIFVCQALIDRFPALWGALKNEIKRLNVECEVIPGENPWIRDYMPVDIPDFGLFQFRYAPKYHADPQYRESEVVFVPEHLSRDCIKLNWVMDGGGLLVDDRVVLLSSKFPPPDPSMLDVFQGKHVLTIPVSSNEFTGHLDGLCRLYGRKFLYHDYAKVDISNWQEISDKMTKWGYEPIEIPSAVIEGQDDSAQGVYLNYVIVGEKALVPVSDEVDTAQQRRALVALQKALELELVEIPADECAREGGALHCVIWDDPLSKTED